MNKSQKIIAGVAAGVVVLTIVIIVLILKKKKPAEWVRFEWAGGQQYGRGLHAPKYYIRMKEGDLGPGDLVQIVVDQNEFDGYNGIWPVVATGDDTGVAEWEKKLVGINLHTQNGAKGWVRQVYRQDQPIDNPPV